MKSIQSKLIGAAQAAAEPKSPGGAQHGRVPTGPRKRSEALIEALSEPGARDVRDRMLDHGASVDFTAAIIRRVLASGARGTWAIDEAANAIARSIAVKPAPRRNKHSHVPYIFVFTGPTGAGKTSTAAKLGRRLLASGSSVLFASLDPAGAASLRRLAFGARKSDAAEQEVLIIGSPEHLLATLKRRRQTDIIILDTPGLSPRDEAGLHQLGADLNQLSAFGPMETYLLLPATFSRASLRLTQNAYRCLRPNACVLTKLDETNEPGTVLSEAARSRLPVAFLSNGVDTNAHLERPNAGDFANMLLRGKR